MPLPATLPPALSRFPVHADQIAHSLWDGEYLRMALAQDGGYGFRCPDGSFEPYFVVQANDVPPRLVTVWDSEDDNWKGVVLTAYVYRWDFATVQWVYVDGSVFDEDHTTRPLEGAVVIANLPPEGGIIRVLARATRFGSPRGLQMWVSGPPEIARTIGTSARQLRHPGKGALHANQPPTLVLLRRALALNHDLDCWWSGPRTDAGARHPAAGAILFSDSRRPDWISRPPQSWSSWRWGRVDGHRAERRLRLSLPKRLLRTLFRRSVQ
jgi:hypothetical protein